MKEVEEAQVIVLNRGAHFRSDTHLREGLRSTLRHLRNRFPEKLLVFRSTAAGHADCTRHERPLEKPQDLKTLKNPYKFPYMWDQFPRQNAISKEVVEEVGGLFMDVQTMTSYRADSHQGFLKEINITDCLHYCLPGPLDGWSQLLFNTLTQVMP